MEGVRGRKLPPISRNVEPNASPQSSPRRKKKRPPSDTENNGSSARRPLPQSPRKDEEESSTPGANMAVEVAPTGEIRTKPRRPKTVKEDIPSSNEADGSAVKGTSASPKPKKKRKKPMAESSANGEVNTRQTEQLDLPERPKKKKKRKPKLKPEVETHTNLGLEAELDDLEDDVVVTDSSESIDGAAWNGQAMHSEPVPKIFIEQKSGFKSANKSKIAQKRAEELQKATEIPVAKESMTTSQFAADTHRRFKTITVFLQGLFSGLCLWQIVTVWILSNVSWDNFLEQYYILAQPVQAMYYWLYAVCTVAVFDRYDISHPTRRFVKSSVAFQTGAIACLFYFSGLVFSLAIANIDEKIGQSQKEDLDPPLWNNEQERDSELRTWRILNLMRGLMCILGWFVVSLRPNTDRLTKNLARGDENLIGLENPEEMSGAVTEPA